MTDATIKALTIEPNFTWRGWRFGAEAAPTGGNK
jgi:hypothetical protein